MTYDPLWLSVALAFEGLRETSGPTSNPVILKWARDIDAPGWYKDDDQPWCAVFLNRLFMACQLPMAGTGFDLLRALTFAEWGVTLVEPALGAVMVFERPQGAHVGLYLGERVDAYRVFGGNTNDAVGPAWLLKTRLRAIRWPLGMVLPTPSRVLLTADGAVSVNEA